MEGKLSNFTFFNYRLQKLTQLKIINNKNEEVRKLKDRNVEPIFLFQRCQNFFISYNILMILNKILI